MVKILTSISDAKSIAVMMLAIIIIMMIALSLIIIDLLVLKFSHDRFLIKGLLGHKHTSTWAHLLGWAHKHMSTLALDKHWSTQAHKPTSTQLYFAPTSFVLSSSLHLPCVTFPPDFFSSNILPLEIVVKYFAIYGCCLNDLKETTVAWIMITW